jgi:hypothetical protein
MSADEKFCQEVVRRIDEATSLTGHQFPDLRELFKKLGVLEAVRLLMSPGTGAGFTYGFRILISADFLHLSIEQAVIDFANLGLFTDEQVSKARATLAMARMLSKSRDRQRMVPSNDGR